MGNSAPTIPADLTKEKHLWAVFRASQKLPGTTGPSWARFIGILIISFYVGFTIGTGVPDASVTVTTVRELAKDGLGFSSQVIGFVLAGFTIFATMNAREFTLKMATTREPTTGFPYVKYVYLSFIRVFSLYIGFIAICLTVRLTGEPSGIAALVINAFPIGWSDGLKLTTARFAFLAVAGMFWIVVVELYSLTFNVYHTVMSGVRWDLEAHNRKEKLQAEHEAELARERSLSTEKKTEPPTSINSTTDHAPTAPAGLPPKTCSISLRLLRSFIRHLLR